MSDDGDTGPTIGSTGADAASTSFEVFAGGVAAVGVISVLGPEGAPHALAAGALVEGGIRGVRGLIGRHAAQRRTARESALADVVEQTLFGDEPTPQQLTELANDEVFADTLFQVWRTAMEAIDPDVVPVLGRLAAAYRGRDKDPFFRGASRTLCDLTGGDLGHLRSVFELAQQARDLHPGTTSHVQIKVDTTTEPPSYSALCRSRRLDAEGAAVLPDERAPQDPDAWTRVFELLATHRLGQLIEERGGFGRPEYLVRSQDAEALNLLLAPDSGGPVA